MVEIVGFPIPKPAGSRLAVLAAVAAAGLASPLVGVPLALGVSGYLTISLSKPNRIVRGRSLSVAQHRRTAIIVGSVVFGITAVFSATLAGFDLAVRLEEQLYNRIEIAAGDGSLKFGETFVQCEGIACARATIVKLATFRTLGLAQLRGFTMHDVRAYGWRQPTGRGNDDWPGKALRGRDDRPR
jgi:hypothetical protein